MSAVGGLFLSFALAASAYSAARLSLKGAWHEAFGKEHNALRAPLKVAAIVLFALSVVPWLSVALGPSVAWMSWLFCILPLAGFPLIAIWPFSRRLAVVAPPLVLAGGAVIF